MNKERNLARLAESQHGVLRRDQVISLGVGRRSIARRLDTGSWEVMYRGVYRLAGSARTFKQRAVAACFAAGPGAVISHRAAGVLWSLPGVSEFVELTVPDCRRVRLPGVPVHRSVRLDRSEIRRIEGITVTSIDRTLIDLAAVLDRRSLDLALDHALANRLISPPRLQQRLHDLGRRGRRGAGNLSAALAERTSQPGVPMSVFESRLLALLKNRGLPKPLCQLKVRLRNGRYVFLDFAFPEALLAIEADSYRHHSSLGDWSRDRTRNSELVALGWRILPVTYQELRRTPGLVAVRVETALRAPMFGTFDTA
jgi:very-short-patch-repair endonuclease